MSKKLIVSLDIGTSSCRAFAISQNGEIVAKETIALSPEREDLTSQYDASEFLKVALQVIDSVLGKVELAEVVGIAIASQRSTFVMWDGETGDAVAPVLTWEDGRATKESQKCTISQEEIHQITGLYNIPYFSAPKIQWCLQNIPVARKTLEGGNLKIAPLPNYLVWHLTKGKVFATDATLAQRMLLLDIAKMKWSEKLCKEFGVPAACLPELRTISNYGIYEFKGGAIPIVTCMGDQQAATLLTSEQEGQVHLNYGTGAFYLQNIGEKLRVLPGVLTSVGTSTKNGKYTYFFEGTINAASSLFMWLASQGIVDDNWIKTREKSASPVKWLPAFGGLGSPYFNTKVKPVSLGVTASTTAQDWTCGALNAIALLMKDISSYLANNQHPLPNFVTASGGMSQVPYLMQLQADLLQKPLHVLPDMEATALGSAKIAFNKLGLAFNYEIKCNIINPTISAEMANKMHLDWQKFVKSAIK